MAGDADAARFFTADKDVTFEHEIADVLEADAALVDPPVMLGGDAIKHFGGVECADDFAGPLLAFQDPAQKDGVDLVRVDEGAVFGDGAHAVGIAISDEAAVALLAHDHLLGSLDMRLDGFRINSGKKRVDLAPDLHVLNAPLFENAREHAATSAVHGVNQELEAGFGDEV